MKTKQAFNPYMPSWEYVPDAEPHVVGDRVYVYGSHDLFNGLNFCLGDYVCWSAPVDDLVIGNMKAVFIKESRIRQLRVFVLQMDLQLRIWFRDQMEDSICITLWVERK